MLPYVLGYQYVLEKLAASPADILPTMKELYAMGVRPGSGLPAEILEKLRKIPRAPIRPFEDLPDSRAALLQRAFRAMKGLPPVVGDVRPNMEFNPTVMKRTTATGPTVKMSPR